MEGMAIDAEYGDRLYAVTGHLPALLQAPAKLSWLRAHRPDTAARVHRVLPLADWLASLLTAEQAMSRSLANEIGLLDVATGEVAAPLLEALDFDPSLVPLALPDGTVAGTVSEGVLAGMRVALCGADTQCALAAMGAREPGEAGVVAGWSTPVQLVASAPVMDSRRRIWTGLHVVPRRWVLESNAGDYGNAWAWMCRLLGLEDARADELAAAAPPGSHDTLAVLGPAVMRAASMNLSTGGLLMPVPLAVSAPDRGDLARAVRECTAYAVRANLEQLEDVAGALATAIALGGGSAASTVFPQMLADVIGRSVRAAASSETSSLGAAAVASPALGLHDTIDRAVGETAPMRRHDPDMARSARYDDGYERWRTLADQLASGAT
jgi:sugar (pentulose or hexulose) kinase